MRAARAERCARRTPRAQNAARAERRARRTQRAQTQRAQNAARAERSAHRTQRAHNAARAECSASLHMCVFTLLFIYNSFETKKGIAVYDNACHFARSCLLSAI